MTGEALEEIDSPDERATNKEFVGLSDGPPVPDLDVECQRLPERHAVEQLVADVAGVPLRARAVAPGLGVERVGVEVIVAPGVAEQARDRPR